MTTTCIDRDTDPSSNASADADEPATSSPLVTPPDRSTFRSSVPPTRRRRVTGRRWRDPLTLLAVFGGIVAVALNPVAPLLIVFLFVVVVPLEMLWPRHGRGLRRPEVGTDILYGLVAAPLGVVGTFVAAVIGGLSLAWLPGLALRPLVGMMPGLVQAIVGIVLFDIAIYWAHRWAHEVPFLWRFHALHHSTRRLDWVSGLRNHPFDGVLIAPAFVLLLAAGFSAEFTGVLAIIQLLTGFFAHANVRWRLRPLHRVILTPEFHHWHHADEPEAINTNYSVFLPIWDVLFGTFYMPADRRPQKYGVSEPMPTGMVRQLVYPFRGLRSPWQVVRHPWRAVVDTVVAVRRGLGQVWRSVRRTGWPRLSGARAPQG